MKKLKNILTEKKYKELNYSYFRPILSLIVYFICFRMFLPQFVYDFQSYQLGYRTGTILVHYQCFAYLLALIPIVIIMFPLLKIEKEIDINKVIVTVAIVLISGFLFNLVFSVFIRFINNGEYVSSINQSGLNELLKQNKYLYYFMCIILAPCLEELIFRGVIFRSIRTKNRFIVAAFVSSILFGYIHVSNSIILGNWIDVSYLILYSCLGFLFCGTYEFNKSIYICILLHALYNAWTIFV